LVACSVRGRAASGDSAVTLDASRVTGSGRWHSRASAPRSTAAPAPEKSPLALTRARCDLSTWARIQNVREAQYMSATGNHRPARDGPGRPSGIRTPVLVAPQCGVVSRRWWQTRCRLHIQVFGVRTARHAALPRVFVRRGVGFADRAAMFGDDRQVGIGDACPAGGVRRAGTVLLSDGATMTSLLRSPTSSARGRRPCYCVLRPEHARGYEPAVT
jgi:hypothetical protein